MTQTLVTGGNGFIGQHLVAALIEQGRRVRVLDLRPPAGAPVAEYIEGSVLDPPVVEAALDDVGEVYHLAALPGMWMPDKGDFHAVNCRGTEIVIAAARQHGIARFLYCSTESILFGSSTAPAVITEDVRTTPEDMPGAYTHSKLLAEQYALKAAASGFPLVIGSPTMPIGAHHGRFTPPTAMLRHFVNRGLHIYLDFVMNLVDVRDVAAGLLLAMERGQVGHRYILGGEDISLRKILDILVAVSGRQARRIAIPGGFAQMTGAVMEFMADHMTRRPPAATVEGVRIAMRSRPLSIEKARRELGYAPRPIEPALRESIVSILGGPR